MTEDLVEKYSARAAGEDGRAGVWFDDRRHTQRLQILDHDVDGLPDLFVAWQPV